MNRTTPLSSTLAALAGVGFAILWFVSVASVDPQRSRTDQELLTWWSDSGNQDAMIVSMFAMLVAALVFLVFLVQLCHLLRSAGGIGERWNGLVFGGGLGFVALISVTAFSRGLIAHAMRFEDEPLPGPDTLRYATAFSQAAMGLGAIPFVAIAIATASVIIVRSAVLARWLGWFGLVVAALTLVVVVLQVGALASPLIMLWTVAASFVLWRSRNAVVATTIQPSASATIPGPKVTAP